MANFAYNVFKKKLLDGVFDLDATDTIKARLVDTSTTADTEKCKATLSAFTAGSKYSGTTDQCIPATQSTSQDNTDNEGVWDSTGTMTFSSVSICGCCKDIEGMIIYKFIQLQKNYFN